MSLLVLGDPPLRSRGGMKGGVEIGVYVSGELVGSGVIQDGVCGIAVWGDDPETETIEGAKEGQALEIRLLSDGEFVNVGYTLLSGEAVYQTDGLAVIELTGMVELPVEFGITSAYPNPFNSRMRVSFGLPEVSEVALNVYDMTGRQVMELTSGRYTAGIHNVVFDGSDLSSGVYMLRLETGGHRSQMKVALVK